MDGWLIAQPLVRLPPRIALVGLDEDLGGYLSDWFCVHWPEARVVVRARRGAASSHARLPLSSPDPA